jgi:hypothetical protein
MAEEYRVGQAITDTATFTNTAGTPTEPTTVTATLLHPDGTTTSPSISSGATGIRIVSFTPDAPGTWVLKWLSTGSVAANVQPIFVVKPDYAWQATDILTLDEAKRAVNHDTTTTTQDEQLAQWITFASRAIDARCGPVVQRTVTEVHDVDGSTSTLFFRQPPVASVTTFKAYTGGALTTYTAETLTTTPTYGYLLDTRLGTVSARSGYANTVLPLGRVELVYVAGRYATTATVGGQFKVAAGAILRRLWIREGGAWARGGDPFADGGSVGFFKVAEQVIDEMLWDQRLAPAVA